VLVERVAVDRDLDPLAAACDDRKNRGAGVGDPHVVLQLGHVLFGRRFLREIPVFVQEEEEEEEEEEFRKDGCDQTV